MLSSYADLKNSWRRLLVDFTEVYKPAYRQEHWESPLEEGDYQATLPIEALIIDTALAMILSTPPLLTVVPTNEDSQRSATEADKAERWHMGVDLMNDRANGLDTKAVALFNSLLYGLGWIREVAAFPDDWGEDYDSEDLHYAFPFVQQALYPTQVLAHSGRAPGGIVRLAYEADYTVDEIENEWGVRLRLLQGEKGRFLPRNPLEVRRLIDYWAWITEKGVPVLYHSAFIPAPEQFVKRPVPMPEYRRIPYYPVPCYQTGESKPHERYLSFLFKLKELPHLAEIVVSRMLRLAEMYADPQVIIKRSGGQSITFLKAPGSVTEIGIDEDIHYLSWQGSPPDVDKVRGVLMELIYQAGFAPALFSQGTGDTGLARVVDVEQALFKIAQPARNFKRALEELYWHRTQLLRAFSPSVKVPAWGEDAIGKSYSVAMSGNQLLHLSNVQVSLRPGLHSRMLADINIATQALNAKLWGPDRAMDFIGVQDKEEAREDILRATMEAREDVQQAHAQIYMRNLLEELADLGPEGGEAASAMTMGGIPQPTPLNANQKPARPGLQPLVQGVGNGLRSQQLGQGANPNPTGQAEGAAAALARIARGRPRTRPTLGGQP